MIWNYFIYIGIISVVLWFSGAWMAWKDKEKGAIALTMAGLCLWQSM